MTVFAAWGKLGKLYGNIERQRVPGLVQGVVLLYGIWILH